MSRPSDNKTSKTFSALKADVDETTEILKVTVDKLVDREDKLHALNDRASELNTTSTHFHSTARRVKREMQCRSWKLTIIIVVVVLVVVGLIVLIVLKPWEKH